MTKRSNGNPRIVIAGWRYRESLTYAIRVVRPHHWPLRPSSSGRLASSSSLLLFCFHSLLSCPPSLPLSVRPSGSVSADSALRRLRAQVTGHPSSVVLHTADGFLGVEFCVVGRSCGRAHPTHPSPLYDRPRFVVVVTSSVLASSIFDNRPLSSRWTSQPFT